MTIESIASGGDGIGRVDGLAVFVPRSAPGDVAEVSYRAKGRFGRGVMERLVQPSANRVDATCRHYDADDCGGCQLQHLAYDAQLEAKRQVVHDALHRIARRDIEVPPVVPSPEQWRYRSRLTLAMRRRGNGWAMGLHSWKDVDRVFNLSECPITNDRVVAAWRGVMAASAHLPHASELRGTVRLHGDTQSFTIEGGEAWPGARSFAEACRDLDLILWRTASGVSRTMVERGQSVGGAGAFEQVNHPVAAMARGDVVEQAMTFAPVTAIDAYAGSGDTAAVLTGRGVRVSVIESDPDATALASAHRPALSRVITGRVEEELPGLLPADVVILNPPRAGVDARVTTALEGSEAVHGIVYMSCDPATLARDLARLPSWRLGWIRAYDMFPQTAHVEVVCALVREDA